MFKRIILSLIFHQLLSNLSFSQSINTEGRIIGSIDGIDTAFLLVIEPRNDSIIGHFPIINGKFEVTHSSEYVTKFIFRIMPMNIGFRAIIEPGDGFIKVDTAKTQWFSDPNDSKNTWGLIWEIEQWGTPIVEDWNKMMNETENYKYTSESQILYKNLETFGEQEDSAIYIQTMIDSLSNDQFSKLKKWVAQFIDLNPGSSSSAFLLLEIYSNDRFPNPTYYTELIDKLIPHFKSTPTYVTLEDIRKKLDRGLEGYLIPSFSLKQQDGRGFSIEEFKGKYVIIDFWASWCAPCRASIPKLKELYQKFSKNGLEIIGLSTDKDVSAWNRALTQEKMPWVQLIDAPIEFLNNETLLDYFNIKAIPFYLIVNSKGVIIKSSNDSGELIEYITTLF
jgi:thiol-disulfide isomerase/thioredoxin